MKLVKAGTGDLNPAGLVGKADHVVASMTSNVNFTTPIPALATVTTSRDALVLAIANAENRGRAEIDIRDAAADELRALLAALVRYVNVEAAGDVDKAVSSGFELVKTPQSVAELSAPLDVEVSGKNIEGTLRLKWKPVEGARMYNMYVNTSDPTKPEAWRLVAVSSVSRKTIKDLPPGAFCSFRVTALGTAGEGPASEIVSRRAA
ncbi:MAG: fibronectin type III domain-containing protein [Flavobacteriales bacterium]